MSALNFLYPDYILRCAAVALQTSAERQEAVLLALHLKAPPPEAQHHLSVIAVTVARQPSTSGLQQLLSTSWRRC